MRSLLNSLSTITTNTHLQLHINCSCSPIPIYFRLQSAIGSSAEKACLLYNYQQKAVSANSIPLHYQCTQVHGQFPIVPSASQVSNSIGYLLFWVNGNPLTISVFAKLALLNMPCIGDSNIARTYKYSTVNQHRLTFRTETQA